MMTKRKSNPWARAKYLYVLPLAAVAVVAFARPELSGVTNQIAAAKVSDLPAIVKEKVKESVAPLQPVDSLKGKLHDISVRMMTIKNGAGTDTTITVQFTQADVAGVGSQRKVGTEVITDSAVHIVVDGEPQGKGLGALQSLSSDRISSITVLKNGKKQEESGSKDDKVFISITTKDDGVDQAAEFPGGHEALHKYLEKNMRHPKVDTRPGTVFVHFMIDEEGRVSNPTVLQGIAEAFDAEAIRLVEAMPRWTPAMKDGKPVATEFTLPVYFPSALAENFPDLSKTQSHPLVVVDGVLMEWEAFDLQVQPSEIESFRILTGEDAAAYGTRGEREGVIIITRKKTASAAQADSVPHIRIRINGNADGNVGSKMAVAGVVTDEAGSPIVGAIVREVGGKDGVVTDREGRFSLSVPRDATLEVMYVGFQTVKAKPQANMTVVLKPE